MTEIEDLYAPPATTPGMWTAEDARRSQKETDEFNTAFPLIGRSPLRAGEKIISYSPRGYSKSTFAERLREEQGRIAALERERLRLEAIEEQNEFLSSPLANTW